MANMRWSCLLQWMSPMTIMVPYECMLSLSILYLVTTQLKTFSQNNIHNKINVKFRLNCIQYRVKGVKKNYNLKKKGLQISNIK